MSLFKSKEGLGGNHATSAVALPEITYGENLTRELDKKLNWLRAAVLGANDGIVSVAGVVIGVASAGADYSAILLAGVAALVAGSISMAGGEYASVSAQLDTEIAHGRTREESSAHPWAAAWSSFFAFTAGAILPLLAVVGPWAEFRVEITAVAVVFALAFTGYWAAWVGNSNRLRGVLRNVVVSVLTVGGSYLVGALLGSMVI